MKYIFILIPIFSILISLNTVLAEEPKKAKESCGNSFFWDELKSRALCDVGNSPIACLPLNTLGAALVAPGFYKMGFAGANAIESAKAIRIFKEADRLQAINKTSKTIGGHARENANGEDSLSQEEKTRLRALHDSMFKRAENAKLELEKISKSPYYSTTFEYMRFINDTFELPKGIQSKNIRSSEVANLVNLYNQYNEAIKDVEGLKNLRFYGGMDEYREPLSQKQLAKIDSDIKENIQKIRNLRPQVLKAYGNIYKGLPSAFNKKAAGAAGAIGMVVGVPMVEVLKEPLKRALCGFNSTETGKAMADIGAVAVIDKGGCRIEIPNHQVFALSMQDEETLESLPKPICLALQNQIEAMRKRQEKERPVMTGSPQCTADGFKVSVTVNDRKYTHEYKKTKDGALTLKASFFPDSNQSKSLKDLPYGEERFSFSVNSLDAGAGWSKLNTSLSQWNSFAAGDPLLGKTQGLSEAIRYYQEAGDKQSPPTVHDARISLSSGSMALNYIYSVGEQLTAANKYLPSAIEYCESDMKSAQKTQSAPPPKDGVR